MAAWLSLERALTAKRFATSRGCIVTPGLIDLHTHVYWGGTSLGVDPLILARGGCTTLVDTGSAGPGNYPGFLEHVIRPSPVRIIALLNVSFAGIYGFSKRVMVGESGDLRLMAPIDAVEVARANRDTIGGIKVRVGFHASQNSGTVPLDIALKVAEEAGLPLMAHIDVPPPTLEEVLERLRPGDILTHCFRPFPNNPTTPEGGVRPAVIEARKRGVIFDIGHGMGSFAFKTARTMLANGFAPDCISSDVHALCIDGPAFDLLTTMSKFLCLGLRSWTRCGRRRKRRRKRCAAAISERLRPGAAGDASVLELETGDFDYVDSTGERLAGRTRLSARAVVMNGNCWKVEPVFILHTCIEDHCAMTTKTPEERLAALGLTLPAVPTPMANYVPYRLAGNLLYLSGQGPKRADGSFMVGRLGKDASVEQGYEAARLTGLQLLAVAKAALGELSRVEAVVKLLGMVNAEPDFGDHPKVINGCSDLMVEVLGDAGRHARSAVGMGSLPNGIMVEIEAILQIKA